ncbi:NYN domain-containing protein [Kitasatospora sp. NPDC051853]|uniref:NYN domain-containing protein n=1 Tax=Kitasatospora sp. NPDC051853 TaxID=3364058 RepID=UPI0037AE9A1A
MDRCVVLVDAGYLLGATANLLTGQPSRARLTVDHAGLATALAERAEAETGLPLLRIYWFDAAPDRRSLPEHRRLRSLPRVTVRLGALTRAEGRWVQKGVDAAMHAELTELAHNRACADLVLLSGDGDLLPGMVCAKEHGVVVHLWAVQPVDHDFNQSEDLVAEADERQVLDRAFVERWAQPRELQTSVQLPLPAAAAAAPATAAPDGASLPGEAEPDPESEPEPEVPAAVVLPGPAGLRVVPTPRDLAVRPGPGTPPALVLRWSSDRLTAVTGPAAAAAATAPSAVPVGPPTLAELTGPEQRWADREEDSAEAPADAQAVGRRFAVRWLSRLGADTVLTRLWADHPRIPHRLDAELLRYAARFGLLAARDDQIDEGHRYAIRAGFWDAFAEAVPRPGLAVAQE